MQGGKHELSRHRAASDWSTTGPSGLVVHGFGALHPRLPNVAASVGARLPPVGLAIGGRHFRSVDNLGVSHHLSGESRGPGLAVAGARPADRPCLALLKKEDLQLTLSGTCRATKVWWAEPQDDLFAR